MVNCDADQQVFNTEGERQLKFFIQKDLDEKIIQNLTDHITANGGRVEGKVPIQGYILIEPSSREGTRLINCWSTAERPLRHFVPHTFVAACLQARKVLPQVFRKAEGPMRMHIHSSITNERVVEVLQGRIWHSGGDPTLTEEEANVIIADESSSIFRALVDRYEHSRDKYVEPIPWVKRCVETGVYENTPVVKKNLGGRPAGHTRTEFTDADDNHLACYIACRLPDPSMRGRTGNKLYQDLCSRLDLYPWADRHPWQSWRERYKNHVPRFRRLVTTYVEKQPASSDGKGLHGFVRAPFPSSSKSHNEDQHPVDNLTEEHAEWGSQWEVKISRKSPPAWGKGKGKRKASETNGGPESPSKKVKSPVLPPGEVATTEQLQAWKLIAKGYKPDNPPPLTAPESSQIAPDAPSDRSKTRSRSPEASGTAGARQAVGLDSDDDEEAVGSETQVFLAAHKNLISGGSTAEAHVETPQPREADREQESGPTHDDSDIPAMLRQCLPRHQSHPNHELVHIACSYHFMLDEVIEVYEELGKDAAATKQHFKEIRECIIAKRKAWAK